jgi:hypothetical protein
LETPHIFQGVCDGLRRERIYKTLSSAATIQYYSNASFQHKVGANAKQFSKKSKPWAYWGQHDGLILVVPPGTCDEIKNVDLNKLSFLHAVEDVRGLEQLSLPPVPSC